MINYAWANPNTQLREQSDSLDEAKARVWDELHTPAEQHADACPIFQQEPVGQVGPTSLNFAGVSQLFLDNRARTYAWADPRNGKRFWADSWQDAAAIIQTDFKDMQHGAPSSVIVYAQVEVCTVNYTDPRPEEEKPGEQPKPSEPSIDELIQRVLVEQALTDQPAVLAQLYAARALQEIAYRTARKRCKRWPTAYRREQTLPTETGAPPDAPEPGGETSVPRT